MPPFLFGTDPEGAATSAVLDAVNRGGDLRVTAWILESMADTFALLAFAQACDELDEAEMPHPAAPGPGQEYADAMPEVPPALRAECQRAAVLLYAAVLAAPGGYDPAPALLRWAWPNNYAGARLVPWAGQPGGRDLDEWCREAAARCWGHYAVMEAVGHGVSWEDDNEPLMTEPVEAGEVADPPGPANLLPDGRVNYYLLGVGDLGVTAETPTWEDEHTRAAWEKLDQAERRHAESVGRVEE
jgi:hypothetical protein